MAGQTGGGTPLERPTERKCILTPEFANQEYLFLHEMGHVLGLPQPADKATGLDVTLMAWAETVRQPLQRLGSREDHHLYPW